MNRYLIQLDNGVSPEDVLTEVFDVARKTIADCLKSNTNCPLLDEMQAVLEIIEITEEPAMAPVVYVTNDESGDENIDMNDGDMDDGSLD